MPEKEYIIFCDESDKDGKYYSNFYGGVLVGASQYQRITERLNALKQQLNLLGEIKWSKVTEQYLPKYEAMIRCFFEEIASDNLKVRILFTHNTRQAQNLTPEDIEMGYFKLYYQFVKHGFGLRYIPPTEGNTRLRLYFDQFPHSKEKVSKFKGYILGLNESVGFKKACLIVRPEDVTEVLSHDHVLLQCLDIVLGSMSFRLNDKHLEKPLGARLRGKRTRAKEKLYKTILAEIWKIYPHLNIGISTGINNDRANRWKRPYMHWCFQSLSSAYDDAYVKGQKK